MNYNNNKQIIALLLVLVILFTAGCSNANGNAITDVNLELAEDKASNEVALNKEKEDQQDKIRTEDKDKNNTKNRYSIDQALSDNAQLSTIAFSGLAFITGNAGADSFIPPGKVADFFGVQYMRDVDEAGYGHNTQFLSRVANNMLHILNDEQKGELIELASEQAPLFVNFAYNRFPILNAFRDSLEGRDGLNQEVVANYTENLYGLDAELTYNRAVVLGRIINSFTEEQTEYLENMEFNNFDTWPDVEEDSELKKSMTNTEFVAVMTYASEMFSWYKGSLEADIYFCPERHGTYFGGFFMKDYPAMNNPDYFISIAVTGDKGQDFLEILNDGQRELIESIIDEQREAMLEIAELRSNISNELRNAQDGSDIDKESVYEMIARYGYLDGEISSLYAIRFSQINETLTDKQREALITLRDLDVVPEGSYMFSDEITTPEIVNIDFMFGIGDMPAKSGSVDAPDSFTPIPKKNKNS